ncbi:MAG: hypothetical protein ACI4V4_02460 [Eubacterium sp.]
MEFNWINIFGAIIVIIMLIPNIIFAVRCKEQQTNKAGKAVTVIEQIGRYGCMALMVIPLFVWKFGFAPLEFMFVYIISNALLLIMYYVFWALYFKNKSMGNALALAIIPTLIFIVSAVSLNHWSLLVMAVLFGISHIYITYINNIKQQN